MSGLLPHSVEVSSTPSLFDAHETSIDGTDTDSPLQQSQQTEFNTIAQTEKHEKHLSPFMQQRLSVFEADHSSSDVPHSSSVDASGFPSVTHAVERIEHEREYDQEVEAGGQHAEPPSPNSRLQRQPVGMIEVQQARASAGIEKPLPRPTDDAPMSPSASYEAAITKEEGLLSFNHEFQVYDPSQPLNTSHLLSPLRMSSDAADATIQVNSPPLLIMHSPSSSHTVSHTNQSLPPPALTANSVSREMPSLSRAPSNTASSAPTAVETIPREVVTWHPSVLSNQSTSSSVALSKLLEVHPQLHCLIIDGHAESNDSGIPGIKDLTALSQVLSKKCKMVQEIYFMNLGTRVSPTSSAFSLPVSYVPSLAPLNAMDSLSSLHLNHCNLSNLSQLSLSALSGCSRLTELDLSHNSFSKIGAAILCLMHLKSLNLSNNALANLSDFSLLRNVKTLRFLSVWGNPLTDRAVDGNELLQVKNRLEEICDGKLQAIVEEPQPNLRTLLPHAPFEPEPVVSTLLPSSTASISAPVRDILDQSVTIDSKLLSPVTVASIAMAATPAAAHAQSHAVASHTPGANVAIPRTTLAPRATPPSSAGVTTAAYMNSPPLFDAEYEAKQRKLRQDQKMLEWELRRTLDTEVIRDFSSPAKPVGSSAAAAAAGTPLTASKKGGLSESEAMALNNGMKSPSQLMKEQLKREFDALAHEQNLASIASTSSAKKAGKGLDFDVVASPHRNNPASQPVSSLPPLPQYTVSLQHHNSNEEFIPQLVVNEAMLREADRRSDSSVMTMDSLHDHSQQETAGLMLNSTGLLNASNVGNDSVADYQQLSNLNSARLNLSSTHVDLNATSASQANDNNDKKSNATQRKALSRKMQTPAVVRKRPASYAHVPSTLQIYRTQAHSHNNSMTRESPMSPAASSSKIAQLEAELKNYRQKVDEVVKEKEMVHRQYIKLQAAISDSVIDGEAISVPEEDKAPVIIEVVKNNSNDLQFSPLSPQNPRAPASSPAANKSHHEHFRLLERYSRLSNQLSRLGKELYENERNQRATASLIQQANMSLDGTVAVSTTHDFPMSPDSVDKAKQHTIRTDNLLKELDRAGKEHRSLLEQIREGETEKKRILDALCEFDQEEAALAPVLALQQQQQDAAAASAGGSAPISPSQAPKHLASVLKSALQRDPSETTNKHVSFRMDLSPLPSDDALTPAFVAATPNPFPSPTASATPMSTVINQEQVEAQAQKLFDTHASLYTQRVEELEQALVIKQKEEEEKLLKEKAVQNYYQEELRRAQEEANQLREALLKQQAINSAPPSAPPSAPSTARQLLANIELPSLPQTARSVASTSRSLPDTLPDLPPSAANTFRSGIVTSRESARNLPDLLPDLPSSALNTQRSEVPPSVPPSVPHTARDADPLSEHSNRLDPLFFLSALHNKILSPKHDAQPSPSLPQTSADAEAPHETTEKVSYSHFDERMKVELGTTSPLSPRMMQSQPKSPPVVKSDMDRIEEIRQRALARQAEAERQIAQEREAAEQIAAEAVARRLDEEERKERDEADQIAQALNQTLEQTQHVPASMIGASSFQLPVASNVTNASAADPLSSPSSVPRSAPESPSRSADADAPTSLAQIQALNSSAQALALAQAKERDAIRRVAMLEDRRAMESQVRADQMKVLAIGENQRNKQAAQMAALHRLELQKQQQLEKLVQQEKQLQAASAAAHATFTQQQQHNMMFQHFQKMHLPVASPQPATSPFAKALFISNSQAVPLQDSPVSSPMSGVASHPTTPAVPHATSHEEQQLLAKQEALLQLTKQIEQLQKAKDAQAQHLRAIEIAPVQATQVAVPHPANPVSYEQTLVRPNPATYYDSRKAHPFTQSTASTVSHASTLGASMFTDDGVTTLPRDSQTSSSVQTTVRRGTSSAQPSPAQSPREPPEADIEQFVPTVARPHNSVFNTPMASSRRGSLRASSLTRSQITPHHQPTTQGQAHPAHLYTNTNHQDRPLDEKQAQYVSRIVAAAAEPFIHANQKQLLLNSTVGSSNGVGRSTSSRPERIKREADQRREKREEHLQRLLQAAAAEENATPHRRSRSTSSTTSMQKGSKTPLSTTRGRSKSRVPVMHAPPPDAYLPSETVRRRAEESRVNHSPPTNENGIAWGSWNEGLLAPADDPRLRISSGEQDDPHNPHATLSQYYTDVRARSSPLPADSLAQTVDEAEREMSPTIRHDAEELLQSTSSMNSQQAWNHSLRGGNNTDLAQTVRIESFHAQQQSHAQSFGLAPPPNKNLAHTLNRSFRSPPRVHVSRLSSSSNDPYAEEPCFDATSPYNPNFQRTIQSNYSGVQLNNRAPIRAASVPRSAVAPSQPVEHPSPVVNKTIAVAQQQAMYQEYLQQQQQQQESQSQRSTQPFVHSTPVCAAAPAAALVSYKASAPFNGEAALQPVVKGANVARFYHRPAASPVSSPVAPVNALVSASNGAFLKSSPDEYASGADALAALQATRAKYRAQQAEATSHETH